MVILEIQSC